MPIFRSLMGLLAIVVGVARADADSLVKEGSAAKDEAGWVELFNGKDFAGWQAVENPASWRIEDGQMVAHGPRSMLYYVGDEQNANFRDFVFECEVLLKPNANSGIYFHTRIEPTGWPVYGYEAQLNNTHKDVKKTGGLYAIQDLAESPAKDNEWFTQRVTVQGKRIQVHVNNKLVTDYTEPENVRRPASRKHRLLSSGTFALQGHDPGSEIRFRRIRVKPLKPVLPAAGQANVSQTKGSQTRGE